MTGVPWRALEICWLDGSSLWHLGAWTWNLGAEKLGFSQKQP